MLSYIHLSKLVNVHVRMRILKSCFNCFLYALDVDSGMDVSYGRNGNLITATAGKGAYLMKPIILLTTSPVPLAILVTPLVPRF